MFDNRDSDPSKLKNRDPYVIQTESNYYKKFYTVEQVDFLEDREHGLADVVEVGDTVLWSLQYIILSKTERRSHFQRLSETQST